ncbi:uncharacterized protein LOC133313895 [Gastrolobium bilobum]|uniref:uncharacterized protein LOC133313895 n=1 Tax=Gastrolobium bilobum TaxID=150636 RepID=UPI002AB11B90|nr:uncharacterized protein LOC133313895 [Gastrolobium bilobum]
MAIKIDLMKAYDRLSWSFLQRSLEEIRLPQHLIELIMKCVQSTNINVLWNGGRTKAFRPTRCIRQGDPLSPYLFVIAMEKLSHIIATATSGGLWKPIRVGVKGPQISHLVFADDLMIFMEASEEQLDVLMKCLCLFEEIFGQKLSVDKTTIFFSRKTSDVVADRISQRSGFRRVKNMGRYLGSMMQHGRATRDLYESIVDKVRFKLNSWQQQCLSQKLKKSREASFGEMVRIVGSTMASVGNHRWLTPQSSLQEVASNWDQNIDTNRKVADMITVEGEWDYVELKRWLPQNIINVFKNTLPSNSLDGPDRKMWDLLGESVVSVKALYNILSELRGVGGNESKIWKNIWEWEGPQKVKIFMWKVVHHGLLTMNKVAQWSGGNDMCPICNSERETMLHALRDCLETNQLWLSLVYIDGNYAFYQQGLDEWLSKNIIVGTNISLFFLTCWKVWQWRIEKMRGTSIPPFRSREVLIHKLVNDVEMAVGEEMSI